MQHNHALNTLTSNSAGKKILLSHTPEILTGFWCSLPTAQKKVFQVFQHLIRHFLKPRARGNRQVFHSKISNDQAFICTRNTWNTFSEAYTPHARRTRAREGVPPHLGTFFRNRCPRTDRTAAYMSHGELSRRATRRQTNPNAASGFC